MKIFQPAALLLFAAQAALTTPVKYESHVELVARASAPNVARTTPLRNFQALIAGVLGTSCLFITDNVKLLFPGDVALPSRGNVPSLVSRNSDFIGDLVARALRSVSETLPPSEQGVSLILEAAQTFGSRVWVEIEVPVEGLSTFQTLRSISSALTTTELGDVVVSAVRSLNINGAEEITLDFYIDRTVGPAGFQILEGTKMFLLKVGGILAS